MTVGGVRVETRDGICILRIDHPPTNALSSAVRNGLLEAVEAAGNDPEVRALVLTGTEGRFSSGADISEFGGQRTGPRINAVSMAIEATGKPAFALIEGYAIGGGLELALGCHYRIAAPHTRLGLTEVNLGILPAGGGLQRLPRVIGIEAALDMILRGKVIDAEAAARAGIFDRVAPAEGHMDLVRDILAGGEPLLRTIGSRILADDAANRQALSTLRARFGKRPSTAQGVILDRIDKSLGIALPDAVAQDVEAANLLRLGAPSIALRHLFKAERRVLRSVSDLAGATRPPKTVGVLGAGTMGTGIALSIAQSGLAVVVIDPDDGARHRAVDRIATFDRKQSEAGCKSVAERITLTSDFERLAKCGLVIEAVFEDMGVKHEVLSRVEAIGGPDLVLATNTSFLDIDEMARPLSRPERLIGLHFFSPAERMPLLEVVRGPRSCDDAMQIGAAFAKKIGKTSVLMKACCGFVANRSRSPMMNAARLLVEDGATPAQIDRVMLEFGFPAGPFQTNDQSGIDVYVRGAEFVPPQMRPGRQSKLPFFMVEKGRLGVKSGAGWYRYEPGSRKPVDDPELPALLDEYRNQTGLTARGFTDDEIIERCLYAPVNEAVRIVSERIVDDPDFIDVAWCAGFGFPREKGGLLHWARDHGVERIAARIARDFRPEDPDRWPEADFQAAFGRE